METHTIKRPSFVNLAIRREIKEKVDSLTFHDCLRGMEHHAKFLRREVTEENMHGMEQRNRAEILVALASRVYRGF